MKLRMHLTCLYVLFFAFLTFTVSKIYAQEESVGPSHVIEEITVTSTKRATGELAQNIARASTVVSADMIEQNNLVDLLDVGRMVPNAQFKETSTFPGTQRFWMRTVGVTYSVPNFDPAVGVYQDGVFIAQNIAAILDTFDTESIEILRGPQGTLFGRNTSVGAVITRSKRPTDELEMSARVTVGDYERNDYEFSVSGPISDSINAKLAIQQRNTDEGWITNTAPNSPDLGARDSMHIKAALVFTPSDTIDVTLLAELLERGGDGATAVGLGTCDNGTGCHGLGIADRAWDEAYDEGFPWTSHQDHEIEKFIVEANFDLGHGVITSITGLVTVSEFSGSQFEGISPFIINSRQNIDQEQISQELRYASSFSDTFDITVGLYYFQQDLMYGEQRAQGGRVGKVTPGVDDPANPYGIRSPAHDQLDHEAQAVFAEARWELNDTQAMIVGGRYTEETKDVSMCIIYTGSCKGPQTPPFENAGGWIHGWGAVNGWDVQDKQTWKSFSPKVAFEFRPQDDVLVYVSATRGFRSGGFSFRVGGSELGVQAVDPSFRPGYYDRERVDQLELGFKSDWLDNTLRLNVTAFYQWWDGIQRNLSSGVVGNLVQRTANHKDSHVSGIEIEFSAIMGTNILLDGDMFRTDFNYGKSSSGYDSPYIVGANDLTYRKFAAPHETVYLGLSYEHPVTGGGEMRYRASYSYQEDYCPSGAPRPAISNKFECYRPVKLADVSIQYDSEDGHYFVRLFGKNLDDYEYYSVRVPFSSTFGVGIPAMTRTWGLTVGYNY
ncbi:MAG: hypothetical protein CML87_03350 [Rhodobiaceae bacterium]|jgi:iron complex outermembrane receptor protein|nr:hypothetical protein [Rhodobiaceae bacterium]|tara:strand:+ start:6275 stop:8611 length:2337 start_codon:yes stop_codon:yes gene_type:complete